MKVIKKKVDILEEIKFDELVKTEILDAKRNIKKYIQGALLSIIGLESRSSGDYEIDHCNNRSSVIIDAFRSMAKDEAEKIASNYKPTKDELKVFESAFKREVSRQLSYELTNVAKEKARQLAEEYMDKAKLSADEVIREVFENTVR